MRGEIVSADDIVVELAIPPSVSLCRKHVT
jgi:hypothetical protein